MGQKGRKTSMLTADLRTADAAVSPPPEILAWLDAFGRAIRDVDFAAGTLLFATDVVAFGTVGVLLTGLDDLIASQWKRVWPVTNGFHFHLERLSSEARDDVAWVAVPWTSQGRTAGGQPFDRHGRATYILRRCDGRWLAVHSHHSLDPVQSI